MHKTELHMNITELSVHIVCVYTHGETSNNEYALYMHTLINAHIPVVRIMHIHQICTHTYT
jgi:hypothetical protein